MAGGSGPLVGRVSIKVSPDTRGFREETQRGIGNLKDVKVDITPDTDGFRQKAEAATKGMKAKMDAGLDTTQLKSQAVAAAKAVSGQDVKFDADLDLKGLAAEAMIAARTASGQKVTFIREWKDVGRDFKSKREFNKGFSMADFKLPKKMNNLSGVLESTTKIESKFRKVLKSIKDTVHSTKALNSEFKRTESALRIGDKMRKWSARIKSAGKGDYDTATPRADYEAKLSAIRDEVELLKQLDGVKSKINKKSKKYDAEFASRYSKLKDSLNDIRANRPGSDKDLRANLDALRDLSVAAGASERQQSRLAKRTYDVVAAQEALQKVVKKQDRSLRIGEFKDRIKNDPTIDYIRTYRVMDKLRKKARQLKNDFDLRGIKIEFTPDAKAIDTSKSVESIRTLEEHLKEVSKTAERSASSVEEAGERTRKSVESTRDSVVKADRDVANSAAETVRKQSRQSRILDRKAKKQKNRLPARRILGLTRTGWIAAAISMIAAPAIQLISGAVAALPALLSAAGAAIGVLVLGFKGISDAAGAAAPALNRAKEAVSEKFRDRLTPQFETLGNVIDNITPGFVAVADGISDFTGGMVKAVSSSEGLSNLNKTLFNTQGLFSKMAPFAEDFTAGLLDISAIGSETFPRLAEGLNSFGETFRTAVRDMGASGELQAAIEATYDVLGSFGTNVGRIIGEGIRTAPNMVEGLDSFFTGFADGVIGLLPLFSDFANLAGNTIGTALTEIGQIGEAIGPSLSAAFESVTPGLVSVLQGIGDALQGVGEVAGPAVAALAPLFSLLATEVGTGLSQVGGWLSDLADSSSKNAPNIANDLKTIGTALADMFKLPEMVGDGGIGGFLDKFQKVLGVSAGVVASKLKIKTDIEAEPIDLSAIEAHRAQVVSQVSIAARGVVEDAKRIAADNKVDITPQIEAMESAETVAEFDAAKKGIIDALRAAGAESSDTEVKLSVNPKLDMEGSIAELQSQSITTVTELQSQIDIFKANAEAVASGLSIDIAPQIKLLEGATNAEQFHNITADIVSKIQAAADTTSEQPIVPVDPAVELNTSGIDTATEGVGTAVTEGVTNSMTGVGESIGAAVDAELTGALADVGVTAAGPAAEEIGTALGTALGSVTIPTEGLSTAIGTSITSALGAVVVDSAGLGTNISTAVNGALDSVTVDTSGFSDVVSAAINSALSSLGATATASVTVDLTSSGADAGNSFATGFGSAEGAVSAAGNSLKAAGDIKLDLSGSGAAAGASFAAGIASQYGAVFAAAASLAQAVKQNMPHSPAPEGPLSGKGYTDHSGKALGMDFAKAIRSTAGAVGDASAAVAGAAAKKFQNFTVNPGGSMESFQRAKILDPVLESNAAKISRYREQEAKRIERFNEQAEKRAERSQESIAKINERDSKNANKEKSIADQRANTAKASAEATEKLAKDQEEAKQKLLESLEEPDYGKIDRSFQKYWIDGTKEMLTKGLTDSMREVDFAGKMRESAMGAVQAGRNVFGNHSIFDQIESNVNAEHYADALQRSIEESGIAEIPVNFVISNLDQLKSDLGMGDGVISRAIDAGLNYNPNNTDAQYAKEHPVEIHYHVEDMDEAIRLEQQRERREMMKLR